MKIEVDSYDYQEAIKAVQILLDAIHSSFTSEKGVEIEDIPSATLIVDTVVDKII